MARCVYCQQPAGAWRDRHDACDQQHWAALQAIGPMVSETIQSGNLSLAQTLTQRVRERGLEGYLEESELASTVRAALNAVFLEWIQDVPLDAGSYVAISEIMRGPFFMDVAASRRHSRLPAAPPTSRFFIYEQLLYAERGRVHPYAAMAGSVVRPLPGDQVLFADPATVYGEWRTQVAVAATTVGFGGEYTSFARTQFQTAETSGIAFLERGPLLLGRKGLYFSGPTQVYRIAYDGIMRSRPYADGFSVHRGSDVGPEQFFQPAYPAAVNRVVWMRLNDVEIPDDVGDYPPVWDGHVLA